MSSSKKYHPAEEVSLPREKHFPQGNIFLREERLPQGSISLEKHISFREASPPHGSVFFRKHFLHGNIFLREASLSGKPHRRTAFRKTSPSWKHLLLQKVSPSGKCFPQKVPPPQGSISSMKQLPQGGIFLRDIFSLQGSISSSPFSTIKSHTVKYQSQIISIRFLDGTT